MQQLQVTAVDAKLFAWWKNKSNGCFIFWQVISGAHQNVRVIQTLFIQLLLAEIFSDCFLGMLIQARYIFSPIDFFPLYIFILRALRLRLMIKDAVSNSWVNRHWKKLGGQLISNSVYQVFYFCDIKRTFVQKFAFKTHRIRERNNLQDER